MIILVLIPIIII